MKILIAGAGIGGLYAAYLFGQRGHSVTVYERSESLETMRYDWHDDVNPSIFKRLGLEIPEESFKKADWTFVSPSGKALEMVQKEENIDYSIERRPLNNYLYNLAKEHAEIIFGAEAVGAVCEGAKVIGLKILKDGEEQTVNGDFIIDSCGVMSKVRTSLPAETGVVKNIGKDAVFIAYRAFYNAVEGAEVTYTNKVYLKHMGEQGIAWCIKDNDPTKVNVLVGRVGQMSDVELKKAMEHLREDNPILGKEVQRGGIIATIPVRRPLTCFVCDGYAAIGDAACMTIPMIGSGIGTALLAAKFLFDTAGGNEMVMSAKLLWKYQLACYKEFGAQHWGVEYMKNWLLKHSASDIDWILGSGFLTNDDLAGASVGGMMKLTAKQVFSKLKIGIKKPSLMMAILKMVITSQEIVKSAQKIPKEYNREAIENWTVKMNSNFTQTLY